MDDKWSKTITEETAELGSHEPSEEAQKELATRAMSQIKEAEKISGFGRAVVKLQNLLRDAKPSRSGRTTEWRAIPTLVGLGIALLVMFSVLWLMSEPESRASRRLRAQDTLVGPDDSETLPAPQLAPAPITEEQLVGGDAEAIRIQAEKKAEPRSSVGRRYSHAASSVPDRETGASLPFANTEPIGSGREPTATVFLASVTSQVPMREVEPVTSRRPELSLPTGTEILAHTTNAISSGLDSPVIAVVDQDVRLNGILFVPQGTRVIGFSAGAIKNRVNVKFTSLVLPSGEEIEFSGLALMNDGSAGLVGKVEGKGHPVLAGAGRVATGAAVLATQFAGQTSASLHRPFSQADLLRNQLAAEIGSQGSQLSNRLERPLTVPIVSVPTNQRIRIFLLAPIRLEGGRLRISKSPEAEDDVANLGGEPGDAPLQGLVATQASYIEALEEQLAELRAAVSASRPNDRQR